LSEGKKDKWLIAVTAVNKTGNILYYPVQTAKQTDGSFAVSSFADKYSERVIVRNVTGFLANNVVTIKGEASNIYTENKTSFLYQYDANRIYNFESTFNINHGDSPIVTISHIYPLKKLSDYNIELAATFIDGEYKLSCSNVNFSINLQEQTGKTYLLQSINGRQIRWLRTTATQFVKETDNSTILSYNKSTKTFLYSNADGVACEWIKL
jgi:hypothetical protein